MSGAMWKKGVAIRKGGPLSSLFQRFLNNFSTPLLCNAHVTYTELHAKDKYDEKIIYAPVHLHSMHIIICGDAMSHPLSIIVVWSNNYHMIWIDVTNLHPLIACYIQAILVPTLKTKTQSSHPPDLLCLADDTRCVLCAQAFVLKPKIIEMLPGLIMKLHNIMLNLPHQISCSY